MTTVRLKIQSDDMHDVAVQEMTRGLQDEILRHTDADVRLPSEPRANTKGDAITLGVLAVTFLTSGTAVGVLNVLKSWLERDRSVSLTVERDDGSKTTINAGNPDDAEALVKALADSAPT